MTDQVDQQGTGEGGEGEEQGHRFLEILLRLTQKQWVIPC
jgi:hypothetical protein